MNLDKLKSLAISDSGFIFDPTTGHSFSTNQTGIEIINHLKHEDTLKDILHIMATEYNIDLETLDLDLHDFMENLKKLNMV